jgi:dTMP kinase
VSDAAPGAARDEGIRAALGVPAFRRLWFALSLSSLGDWLGLLATTAMAAALTTNSSADQNYAVSGVFILRLVPALIFAPLAGVVADRLDRKTTMVTADVLRCALFTSIPIVQSLWWLLTATFLIEALSLFWIPAKEATVPNLVPAERLQSANQLSLFTAYGSAPIAAGLFTVLSLISGVLGARFGFFVHQPAALALWVNAASFAVCAVTVSTLPIPRAKGVGEHTRSPLSTLLEGWRYIGTTPMVRGLLLGLLGAFAAGGTVVGLAPTFVRGLGAGNPGYGVLFGAVFVGLAGGMLIGPKVLAGLSRRRMFAMAITAAGLLLVAVAVVPQLPVVTALTVVLGGACGIAWVTGYTLIGLQVPDEMRGRTFAFVQSAVRLTLIAMLAIAPLLSGAIGSHSWHPTQNTTLTYSGAAIVFGAAGLITIVVGIEAYRHMDDRRGISLWQDLRASIRKEAFYPDPITSGYLIAFEGGDGAGKSTQVQRLAEWLTERGHEVVVTREPGATPMGQRLREALLDVGNTGLSPRAEALLYAADRAEHVHALIRPALRRGAVVITDRYVDSSIAYQGAGRALSAAEVERLSHWATQGLQPALTVLLDVAPSVGAVRRGGAPDRIEAESEDFHSRVRQGFLELAGRAPKRYLVLDALRAPTALAAAIQARVAAELAAPGTDGEPLSNARVGEGQSTPQQPNEEAVRR